MRIRFENTDVQTFEGRNGKKERHIQRALVTYGNGETRKWEVGINDKTKPFPVGDYELAEGDFYPGEYGPQVSGWPKLRPVKKA